MMQMIRKKMANQIAVMISLICLCVFVLIGAATYHFLNKELINHKVKETELKASLISKDIQSIFDGARLVTDQMALHPEIISYLKTAVDKDTIRNNPYYASTFQTLINTKESNPLFFLAWVANEKANFYLDSLGIIPDDNYDVKKRPWYQIAVNSKKVAFTTPYVEWATKKVVISSIKALREKDQIYGFVVVDIVLDNIPVIFKNQKINPSDRNFLIGHDGTYIYHEEIDKRMKANLNDPNDGLNPYKNQIMTGESVFREIRFEGKPYFLSTYTVGESGFKVVTLIDQSVIRNEMHLLGLLVFTLLMFAWVLTTTLVYLTVGKAMMPYREILTFAEDIAKGNFSKNIPNDFIQRQDEMGSLGRSFQIITDTFRRENLRLEEHVEKQSLELESQYRVLMETERAAALGNIVAGVAHEINTPIGVSLTTASYLKSIGDEQRRKLELGQMSKRDLVHLMEVIDESTNMLNHNLYRAAELIKSFKQMAVDQSSGMASEFSLKETLDSIIVSLHHEYKNMSVRILNRCPGDVIIKSYPGAYSQIVTNLIMNSLHHGLPDKIGGEITMDVTVEMDQLIFTYHDNGKGIPEKNLNSIFDPFFTTNRKSGNSGLGMHIIKSLVTKQLRGTVICESKEGEGTTFRFTLPVNLEI